MKELVRYRHRWKMPDGTFEYEFGGEAWHPSKESALEGRQGLIKRSRRAENGDYTDYFDESWEWDIEEGTFPIFEGSEGVLIFLEEEYGYRHWMWHTGMTEEELRSFWENLESVGPYFFSPEGLPGKVIPAWFDVYGKTGGGWSWNPATYQPGSHEECSVHEISDTPIFIPPDLIDGEGHIHMDDDSSLNIKGKRIIHKGYSEE